MTNDKLRGVFERLGFEEVASLLASGNIVFGSADTDAHMLEQRVQDALATTSACPTAPSSAPTATSAPPWTVTPSRTDA
jgi:uncharacterized protein (DUF1697 family)